MIPSEMEQDTTSATRYRQHAQLSHAMFYGITLRIIKQITRLLWKQPERGIALLKAAGTEQKKCFNKNVFIFKTITVQQSWHAWVYNDNHLKKICIKIIEYYVRVVVIEYECATLSSWILTSSKTILFA